MKKRSILCTLSALVAIGVFSASGSAFAAGYDTPILYSARHMGMGGVAIAYVNDGSALFHNPAGMARTGRGNLLVNFSPLMGRLTAPILLETPPAGTIYCTPGFGEECPGSTVESELTFAPAFLLGGVGRITDWLVLGLGVFPVASAGGSYIHGCDDNGENCVTDTTTLRFIEMAPGVAFNIPGRVTLGLTWRVTLVQLERSTTPDGADPSLELDLMGLNFAGFRAGVQWEAIEDHLSIGATYRHKTETDVDGDSGFFLATINNPSSSFTLPSRLGFGVRGDLFRFGLGIDFEYTFQSQNEGTAISGTDEAGNGTSVANLFKWDDGITLRIGAEYSVDLGAGRSLPVRAGFIYENQVTNPAYPTAFGTPAGDTYVATVGVGYDHGNFQFNLAYAYRACSGTVSQVTADLHAECRFCHYNGDYDLEMHGLYLDFSYDWR